jgi:hypothetical protein
MTGCEAGFADNNKDDKDGCEYQCPVFPIASRDLQRQRRRLRRPDRRGAAGGRSKLRHRQARRVQNGHDQVRSGGKISASPTTRAARVCDKKTTTATAPSTTASTCKPASHCGKCGNPCSFPNAIPKCVAGVCEDRPLPPGYKDLDTQVAGCEHKCQNWPPSAEKCNQQDDDCDASGRRGLRPEPTQKLRRCGKVCSFPNATASCVASKCTQGPCFTDFYDIDSQVPGCEYYCVKSNNGVEICDDLDNDCNGHGRRRLQQTDRRAKLRHLRQRLPIQ